MRGLEKIDIVMCTWNSNKPWFERCLRSIKREIPLCHFIVIDRFSEDGTQEVIRKNFPDAIIVENNLNLGKARAEAVKYVDAEWFAFIDDDIELFNGWYKEIIKHLNSTVGAIAFTALPEEEWLKKLFLQSPKIAISIRRKWVSEYWVPCTNTLVKTELVRDWSPPSFLSAGEDAHLSKHIMSKGYRVVLLQNYHVKHYGLHGLKGAKKKQWYCSSARLLKHTPITTKRLVRRFLISPLRGLYIGFKVGEDMVIPYIILSDFYSLKGWLCWNKCTVRNDDLFMGYRNP